MKTVAYLLFSFAMLACPLSSSAAAPWLPAGKLVYCTLQEPNFSSKSAEIDDPVICYAHSLPRGSYFIGHFRDYREPGHLTGKGWLMFEFDRLIVQQQEIPVLTKVVSVRDYEVDAQGHILGKGHPKRDVLGWFVPALWPVKFITLGMRGPYPALRGEVAVTLRLLDDVAFPGS